jgi:GNAT superfamily N-acetyltransferase
MKEAAVKKWQNPEFRGKMWAHVLEKRALRPPPPPKVPYVASGETKQRISVASKKMWEDPKFKENMVNLMRLRREDEQYLERLSKRSKEMWEDEAYKETTIAATKRWANMPGVREMLSERGKKRWQDPEYRLKMAKIFANCPKVSSLQTTFYSILDDLGVKYFREYEDKAADPECLIGPWSFDCVIPRPGKTTLLVEIQGFRHYRRDQERRDKSKATYISDNFPDQYEVKYVWDHEFGCKDKVVNTVRYWLGLAQMEILDFNIDDVTIQSCPAKDYRLLLSKYHYLPNAGRGGLAFGVYLQDKLIAVCVFSSLVRQNIKVGEHDPKKTKELSRLCIHPSYQKKNFASWFISRCLKMLEDVSCVISYSDTTFNHNGAVYKASNFILDGEVPPDYWYVKDDGWVMHKKALYDHAVKMDQTEREYAEQRGYSKVWGLKKLRFIYELSSSDK